MTTKSELKSMLKNAEDALKTMQKAREEAKRQVAALTFNINDAKKRIANLKKQIKETK